MIVVALFVTTAALMLHGTCRALCPLLIVAPVAAGLAYLAGWAHLSTFGWALALWGVPAAVAWTLTAMGADTGPRDRRTAGDWT